MLIYLKLTTLSVISAGSTLVAMSLTSVDWPAQTIATAGLLLNLLTGTAAIIAALRAGRADKKTAEVSAKSDVIIGHVNSAASASATKIDEMQRQIDQLVLQLSNSKEVAAVLAATKPTVVITAAPLPPTAP